MHYDFRRIEQKWQAFWEANGTFTVTEDPSKRKLYVLDMFPYPSGSGLHVGHPEGYTATDIYCRYKRMRGFNVLHPIGWDAVGLPAERYALQTGIHPRTTTARNIANFRRQIKMLGLSYDWSREVDTTDPSYYRWTQWIFLQLYNAWYDAPAGRGDENNSCNPSWNYRLVYPRPFCTSLPTCWQPPGTLFRALQRGRDQYFFL